MSNITIKQYKVNYEFLIKNYLDPSLWDKKWTLLVYRDLEWSLLLYSIDTKRKRINFEVKLNKVHSSSIVEYALDHPEDTIEKLKIRINRKMVSLLEDYERSLIRNTEGYQKVYSLRNKAYDRLREIANNFLDENNVTNEAIREAYVDRYVDDNDYDYYNMDTNYLDAHKYTELTDIFYILASVTNLDDLKYKLDKMLTFTKIKELEEELAEMKEYVESEDFYNDMTAALPEI